MSLSDAQQRVHQWVSQFEEGYFQPLTNLARLTEEVGELAREINHRFGQKTKKKDEPEGDLAMEMADILFVLICMANREGIDLQTAFDRMMEKVETRDRDRWTEASHPETKVKGAKLGMVPLSRCSGLQASPTPNPAVAPPTPPAAPDSSGAGPARSCRRPSPPTPGSPARAGVGNPRSGSRR